MRLLWVLAFVATALAATRAASAFTLGTRSDYNTGSTPYSIVVADLNGDGRPDVIVPCIASNLVSVLLNTGGGHLATHVDYFTGPSPTAVAVGDLNGDGRADLVVALQGLDRIAVYLGNGAGGFGPETDYAVGSLPDGLVIADFNEDGRLDVAVATESGLGATVLLGSPSGTLGSRKDYATGSTSTGIATADFDGDGHLDLAVANHSSNTVTILHGDGLGGFGSPTTLAANAPSAIATADVNIDGIPDLVTCSNSSNQVSYWLGPVGTNARVDVALATSASGVALGCLGGATGPVDIAIAGTSQNDAQVLGGNGNGNFVAPTFFPTGSAPQGIALADMNGDGLLDIIVANTGASTVSVLLSNSSVNGSFAPRVDSPVGAFPNALALADLNHDGKLDLVVGNTGNMTASVLLGDGAGGWGPHTDFTVGGGAYGVALADFNGDGNLDLATANGGFNTLSVLLGNGAGSFAPKTDYVTGTFPTAILTADLNHDGRPDLVTANQNANTVSVLLGTGTGTFGAKTDFVTGSLPSFLALADLNGDGHLDLVVSNEGSNTVSVLLGNGTGGFGAKTDFPTASTPIGIAIGDVNGDGKLDLVLADLNALSVSVLPGNGAGGFGARTDYPTGNGPRAVAIRDMNGDGVPDIVVANSTGSSFSVLLGNNTSGFSPHIDTAIVGDPYALLVADLNGDGKPDVAMAGYSFSRVSTLLEMATTHTTLGVTPAMGVKPVSQTLTATVAAPAPGAGLPTGNVFFFDGTTRLGVVQLSGGVAALARNEIRLGTRNLTAVYQGDFKSQASISAVVPERIVLTPAAALTTIQDVGADQGGQVRIAFSPSPFDYFGSPTPIARYDVFRRAAIAGQFARPAEPEAAELAGWDFIASVPANVESEYDLVAPTLADSNQDGLHRAVFLVRAATSTPGLFYDSVSDSGYSVDNLPPAPPAPFTAAYSAGATHLHWGANREPDLWYYRLYRGNSAGFVPSPANVIADPADTGYVDPGAAGSWYKLSAVDVNGNESAFATLSPTGTTAVDDGRALGFALGGAYPNPTIRPGLAVHFALPSAAPAQLELVDMSGRRIASRDVGSLGAGAHVLDVADGRALAPGVYLLRLTQGGEVRISRVAVLR